MGGRGSSSGKAEKARGGSAASTSSSNGAPALDRELIRRANDAGTFVDYGDATNRQYNKNVDEIKNMNMTADERKEAYSKLHELTEKQLKAESQARGAYAAGMGPARFDKQAIQRNQNKAVAAGDDVRSYMNGLRKTQEKKAAQKETQSLSNSLDQAQKSGKLELTHNGKTYFRTSKSSKTWREGSLKDYKAEQKFNKVMKDVPFTNRKAWSSLSASEKAKYYK